ncbi:M23 family metallopeptidase [Alicyclobacillus fastidiosus]|uniref:M23 family metallopeptidase n=1 Tax=Alicyclobacillus fastidiosus TaxID=392011 RepID=A0ABY6ZGH6_9BACL|nr:M23 family metallopeptidase [Alicyclobacillus fastidiosus]WAH41830.1 M23 family metallopeptidase [Alicyclobacillus fastidiosus]GMA63529.1 hypothetical protein GCM10025859_39690 [Alicyclobacillus fastidiosus]
MDEKQHPNNENKKPDAHTKAKGRPANAKRVLAKRWLYPAIYLGAAAVIIGLMYARSQMGSSPTSVTATDSNGTSTPIEQPKEPFVWPVADGTKFDVTVPFFPVKGTLQQQESALVQYDNEYYPHQGIDIKTAGGSSFEVDAALSGTVSKVDNQPLYGQEVVVQSPDGYTETYQSLESVDVKAGETIHQGQTIGTAGANVFEQSQGNHLYFQVDNNGQPVDPESLLPKQ